MIKRIILFLSLIFLILCFSNCSKDNSTEPEVPSQITYQEVVKSVLEPQQTYFDTYTNLLSTIDSSSALDSVLKLFKANPNVQWAEKSLDGINVQYKNGIRSGIVTDIQYLNKAVTDYSKSFTPQSMQKNSSITTNITPLSKKSKIISLFYVEEEQIADAFYTYLPNIGFDTPSISISFRNPEQIDVFKNLTDYGVIYINTSGFPWPSLSNIEDVYLLTRITFESDVFEKYTTDFLAGNLMIKFHLLYGHTVFVGSNFIRSYNNFNINQPMIIGVFGFSALSRLAREMEAGNKGVFIGYDHIDQFDLNENNWVDNLLYNLSEEPINVKQWMDGPFPKSVTGASFTTNIKYKGPENFGLYNGPNWPWRYVNINLDYVDGLCSLSTGGTYLWENLFFGHPYQYVSISADGKTFTAQWDTALSTNSRNRGELSIEVDTTNFMVTNFNAYYIYETYIDNRIDHTQKMEIQGHNIPMAYKADAYLVNEIKGTAVCDAVNYFTFVYTDNVGTQNEMTITLISYTCDANSMVTVHWYKDAY